MPGRCCSSTRRRAHRGSLPSPCGSVPDEAGRSRRPCAPGLPEPTAGPPYGGRPHIPAALPRTRARRSPRHASRPASRPGVAAGRRGRALSRRTARPRWPSVSRAPSGLPRPASSSDDPHRSRSRPLPGFLLSPRSGSEITEIPRRPSDLLPAVEPRRDETPSDEPGRTGRTPPRAACHRPCPPPPDGVASSSRTPKTLPHRSRVLSTGLPTAVPYSVDIGSKRPRDSPTTVVNDTRTQHVGGVVHSHPQDSCGYSHPRNADDDGGPQGRVCRDKS